MHTLLDGFLAGGIERPATWHVEERSAGTIHIVLEIDDAFIRTGGLKQDGSCAVAKEHTGGPILIVQNGRHRVAADHQHFLVRARTNELRAHGQRVSKSGARRGQVKTPRFFRADTFLHQAGGGGKKHVRGDAGEHNEFDLRGIRPGLRQHRLCSFRGHVRGGRAIFHDVAFADAGARADPFVIRFNDFLQVRVGHHLGRNVAGYTRNFCGDGMGHDAPCDLPPWTKTMNFMR